VYEPKDDADWLLYELGGLHRAQVLSTLAALGVPDELQKLGTASVQQLAGSLHCNEADLESLLRAAAGLGCLDEETPRHFTLTAKGEQLCRNKLGDFATFLGAKTQWNAWPGLRDSMRDDVDTTPFTRAFGNDLYAFLRQNPAAANEYDAAIDAFTRYEAAHVVERLDLSQRQSLVDVGGGRGTLLVELLKKASAARGILFDLPHVAAEFEGTLPDRIDVVAGDFFESVPAGSDVYFLKHILHNWDDERAAKILQNCKAAKAAGGIVVVIDALLYPDNRPDLARMMDLEMRVLCGGRERRKPEIRRLFADAGLSLERVEELTPSSWLFVAS